MAYALRPGKLRAFPLLVNSTAFMLKYSCYVVLNVKLSLRILLTSTVALSYHYQLLKYSDP